jgi:hypothetical protein
VAAGGGFGCNHAVFAQDADCRQGSAKLACNLASRTKRHSIRVNHTEIRTFIQRFNGSSGGFPYGFWVFRAFLAWFSGWFGEMG